jgi:hypothetical protein
MAEETEFPSGLDHEGGEELETGDGVPVLAEVGPVAPAAPVTVPAAPVTVPAVQAAVMTAGGFFAGALAMAVVKRLAARRLSDVAALPPPLESWPAGSSRTYLVNVRLISRSGE